MNVFLNGANINYVEFGNRDRMPVTFLHGFPFSHEMWTGQLEVVGESHRAIAYDIRGHGQSDVLDGQYTVEGHVDDLIALLDHLGVDRTVIVGLSMGGYISLRALQRNPERFGAAVLCDTRSEADSNDAKLKRFEAIAAVKEHGSSGLSLPPRPLRDRRKLSPQYRGPSRARPHSASRVRFSRSPHEWTRASPLDRSLSRLLSWWENTML